MRTNRLLLEDQYNIPRVCKKCGGVLVFKGVGEYCCEDCGELDYDDYGKVRLYIEEHKGATAAQIESAIGVSQRSIRHMLKEGRLEVAKDSRTFLRCEVCGKSIRSGQYCPECEITIHRNLEAEQRAQIKRNIQGAGMAQKGEEGQRRFRRENF
ncbi:MAG: hypothetical protein K2J60_01430 [Acetatifactor sp.]|nr:hypothetical protein [Acetatifactor sp.]